MPKEEVCFEYSGAGLRSTSLNTVRFRCKKNLSDMGRHNLNYENQVYPWNNWQTHHFVAEYATGWKLPHKILWMTEHLSAALLAYSHYDMDIELEGDEIPIGDGSSQIWMDLFSRYGLMPHAPVQYESTLRWSYAQGDAQIEIEPAAQFHVLYEIRRGNLSQYYEYHNNEDYFKILKCRTFMEEKYFRTLQAQGMLPGAKDGCGILYQENLSKIEFTSGGPQRHPQELAGHKILDLMGDLGMIAPGLPRLKFYICNGGHALHHQIAERIIQHGNFPRLFT